jgi:hypothetical protein
MIRLRCALQMLGIVFTVTLPLDTLTHRLLAAEPASTTDAADMVPRAERTTPHWNTDIAALLKARCVKCHGPGTREAGLFLATPAGVVRGSEDGPVVVPHDLAASKLWTQVDQQKMPPEDPLPARERELLRRWIIGGAPGLSAGSKAQPVEADHWSFRALMRPPLPTVKNTAQVANPVDRFILARLEAAGLQLAAPAPPLNWLRRTRLALLGLPPTLDELEAFAAPAANPLAAITAAANPAAANPAAVNPAAVNPLGAAEQQLIDRWLSSPQFGVRWGKRWLDAAGYADSNGYFNADTDRPLAYRYRDYVVDSLNSDWPLDQFVREQLAGDELAFAAGYRAGQSASPEIIRWLIATHFLRNGQDGSGESDGNPDEVRADRYYALEASQQLVGGSLMGLTIQCAKCHDHKFEPITQRDFYQLQAILYPAFSIDNWVKPNDRFVLAPLPGELERWQSQLQELDRRLLVERQKLNEWVQANRPAGELLFQDSFDDPEQKLGERWSATAPGDDAPAGTVSVNVDSDERPGARIRAGALQILEGRTAPNAWLSTRQSFDWKPAAKGDAIQVTFDLVANHVDNPAAPAERIGYYLALHDYNDNSVVAGGNLLIDGHPTTSTVVDLDYPGQDAKAIGQIGVTGYRPGHNYGVRITNLDNNQFRLEHLVDFLPEEKTITLAAADLPPGGFGFEYCCGRSFIVDNVRIERFIQQPKDSAPTPSPAEPADKGQRFGNLTKFLEELTKQRQQVESLQKQREAIAAARPGKIAWLTDVKPDPPAVPLLTRGNYATPAEAVEPAGLSVLTDHDNPYEVPMTNGERPSSGRRLALARWMTKPGSRPAALLARVQVNRIWQHYFGVGLVATSDNLGLGGAEPTHPELLEWLSMELIESGWSSKHVHRLIVTSATFAQSSVVEAATAHRDPSNRLYSRFPLVRLDAEAIRDRLLAVSDELDLRLGGTYVPTARNGDGEVRVEESVGGARRRSLYLYQRRTQQLSFLSVFDAPSIVFLSTQRNRSTTPLQSLAQWNSEFVLQRANELATIVAQDQLDLDERLQRLYERALGRRATTAELVLGREALGELMAAHTADAAGRLAAWRDLAQAVLMSNEFLYLD